MIRLVFALLTTAFCLLTTASQAQVPSLINYQGRVLDGSGNPVSANVDIEVRIYTNATGGTAVYGEPVGTVPVNNSIFSIQFGTNATALAAALAFPEAWLEVSVDGLPLSPRQRLVAVPYAIVAETVRGPNLYEDPATGHIGVGTTTPSSLFPMTIRDARGLTTYLQFQTQAGAYQWHMGGNLGGLNFVESGVADYRLFLRPGGNVGVGTGSPGERLVVDGAVKLGTTTNPAPAAGTIRWTGSDFEGYTGSAWVSLSPSAPETSSGSYTPVWTTVSGFSSATPSFVAGEYTRVGDIVTVIGRFSGNGPDYDVGENVATLTVPSGLPVGDLSGGRWVSGVFSSDWFRNAAETNVGMVMHEDATSVRLRVSSSYSGVSGSSCSFTYVTSAP